MKKLIPILALIPMVILAITPPIDFQLDCRINSTFWIWMTLGSGVAAFLFLYQKVSAWLKLFVVWCFVSCFISKAPYMSFTMYWSLIVCAYYYLLCTKIEDWTPVKRAVQSVFFLLCILIIMQLLGKDTLLNFDHKTPVILGTIGNRMITSSFVCILAPFLIFNPLNWIPLVLISFISWSSGAVLSIGAGLCVYAWARLKTLRPLIILIAILAPIVFALLTGDFSPAAFRAGRFPVWKKTIELSVKQPLGYGLGNYKILFPYMCGVEIRDQNPGREWNNSHNDYLQVLWETGFPGLILLLGWAVSMIRKIKDPLKLAGLAILATNMCVHFPGRIIQTAFVILMFLAYCSQGDEKWGQAQSS